MLFLWERSTTRNVSAQTVLDPARLVGSKAVCIETFGVLHLSLQTQHTGHPRHRIQGRKCSSLVLEGPKPGLWTEVRPVQRHREWPPLPGRSSALVPARSGYPGPSQRAPQLSSGIFAILIFVAPIDPPKKLPSTDKDEKEN